MFYELLTGQPLFKREDIAETLAQVLTKEPDLSRVPVRARKLLRRCLEKDPKKRLKDIGEARYYIDEPVVVTPSPRRNILPWVIAAAALPFVAGTYWPRPARAGWLALCGLWVGAGHREALSRSRPGDADD